MDISALILILAMVLIGFLLFKVLKNVLLAIFSVVVGAALIVLGVSIFVFADARQFYDDFNSDDKLVLLSDEQIIAGFDKDGPMSLSEIDIININYRPGNAGNLNENVFVVDSEDYDVAKYDSVGFKTQYDANVKEDGIMYLLKGIREDDISVYPESKMVKLTKFLPMFVMNMIYGVIE